MADEANPHEEITIETPRLTVIDDILFERANQQMTYGHDDQSDAAQPINALPRKAHAYVNFAIEDLDFNRRTGLQPARKKLVIAAALLIAAIVRVDKAIDEQEGGENQEELKL